jgi:hypothetical protein
MQRSEQGKMWLCGSLAGVGYLDGLKKFEFC